MREVAAEGEVAHRCIARTGCPGHCTAGNRVINIPRGSLEIEAVDKRHIIGGTDKVAVKFSEDLVGVEAAMDRNDRDALAVGNRIVRITAIIEQAWRRIGPLGAMLDTERQTQVPARKAEKGAIDVRRKYELPIVRDVRDRR